MTVTLNSAIYGNALSLDDRGKCEVVALSTVSTAITLSTADSGKFLLLPAVTSGATITLPTMADGLHYEIYVKGALASGTYSFASATADTIVGYNDAALDSINIGKATGAGVIGGSVRFISDGSKWYSVMRPAFTSAAPTTLTATEFGLVS